MYLKEIKINGFKSFGNSSTFTFPTNITGIVGPNGSGKSNITEAFRFVLGEQSIKTLRSKKGVDLIFNGGSNVAMSKSASVKLIFNNKDKKIPISFDEVVLEREVFKDGTNEYRINGSEVRQKDIIELISKINLGPSGHHIISQGEADRILNAKPIERKEMIEDGLGLKYLQFKKTESVKKLERSKINVRETELMQREISPHLTHLKREVDKIEKIKEIKNKLLDMYEKYLSTEKHYLESREKEIRELRSKLENEINIVEDKIIKLKEESDTSKIVDEFKKETENIQKRLHTVRSNKDEITRLMGRKEGEINTLQQKQKELENITIDRNTIQSIYEEANKEIEKVNEDNLFFKKILLSVLNKLRNALSSNIIFTSSVEDIEKEYSKMEIKFNSILQEEKIILEDQNKLNKKQEGLLKRGKEEENKMISLITEKNNIQTQITQNDFSAKTLFEDKELFELELNEGKVLIGDEINRYLRVSNVEKMTRKQQKENRKELEKVKIKIEALGVDINQEIYKEYEELKKRNEFLNNEKEDILKSIKDLEENIEIIQKEIDTRFKKGIASTNKQFEHFFKTLFGGGFASLTLETIEKQKEDDKIIKDIGINISIKMPYKKITSLDQLSGGERALVSIALLFAISQVTPPPFLILDETDAALDEANSKRYADMIEELAKKSQLILVTHNRETMYRAGALYGVTMNTSGISTVLSVKFEEALEVAK